MILWVEFSVLQVAFTRKKNFGKEAHELQWARAKSTKDTSWVAPT
jgi:hypothetical protein